jgi:hypothetical protein
MNIVDSMFDKFFDVKKLFKSLFVAFFTILLLTASWQSTLAQGNPDAPGLTKAPGLFIKQIVPGARKMNDAAIRHRSVQLNIDHLKNKDLLLNLFDDAEFAAERTQIKEGAEGAFTWSGKLKGPVGGSALITVFGNSVAGSISTDDGRLFEINSSPGNGITIEEIDLNKLPPHIDPISPDNAPFEEGSLESPESQNTPVISADSGDTIDLMILYTPNTRERWGASGIQSKIINAVDAMNSAQANSLINARYRLVYMGEINYTETGDMGQALDRITGTSDGYIDNVHTLRNQYGADIVSLIDEDSNACGIAWVMTPNQLTDNRMARLAFNVTNSGCLSGHTLTHEIGHNEGCAHNRENAGVSGSYDFSYGHRDTTAGFRTIMSYSCSGGACPRISHFSNPNVNYDGAPTGIDHDVDPLESADNARTKNNNETIIANWRQAVESTVPQAPSNLDAVAVSGERIDVSWVDNADNEDGFYLERSPNGVNTWTVIATLASNVTSHSNNGLTGLTTYFYRVRAFNGVGNSPYSNADSATTFANDTTPPTITAPANITTEATGVTTPVALGTPVVSDDTDPSPSVVADNMGPYPVGMTEVTWTATDASGNSASDTQLITIIDSTPPTITAPADVTVVATGDWTAVNLETPTVSDIADPSPATAPDNSGPFAIGTTIVTWTATDASGNSASDTQNVIVEAPVAQPPAAPSNLTASVENNGRGRDKTKIATLNWTDNSGNETSFIIERCEETGKGKNKTCIFAPYDSVGANVTTYTDVPVSGNFKYRVKAGNENGHSAYTNEVKI